jgi:hypothetical protein
MTTYPEFFNESAMKLILRLVEMYRTPLMITPMDFESVQQVTCVMILFDTFRCARNFCLKNSIPCDTLPSLPRYYNVPLYSGKNLAMGICLTFLA